MTAIDMDPVDMGPIDMKPADMDPADMKPADMDSIDMSPMEIYEADLALDNEIRSIYGDKALGKKEKRRLLGALQDQSCNAHLRSHVQYYLDLLQPKVSAILLTSLSVISVLTFTLYAIFRLISVL